MDDREKPLLERAEFDRWLRSASLEACLPEGFLSGEEGGVAAESWLLEWDFFVAKMLGIESCRRAGCGKAQGLRNRLLIHSVRLVARWYSTYGGSAPGAAAHHRNEKGQTIAGSVWVPVPVPVPLPGLPRYLGTWVFHRRAQTRLAEWIMRRY